MNAPPTIYALLDDPVWSTYARETPLLPPNLEYGTPWQIWAYRTTSNGFRRWASARHTTYTMAWGALMKYVRHRTYEDLAIVSLRMLFRPPKAVALHTLPGYRIEDWCQRCRRPSIFNKTMRHHAVVGFTSSDGEHRCFYCGARQPFAALGKD